MSDAIAVAAVLLLTGVAFGIWINRLPPSLRLFAWGSYAAHALSAFVMLWIIFHLYNGVGDALSYLRNGQILAEYARLDPADHVPELVMLVLGKDPHLPFRVLGTGSSTGAMSGLAALLMIPLDSIWATNLLMSMVAFSGQMALLSALRTVSPPEQHKRAALGVLLLPSVVFWSSGVQKEAVALAGLGWLIWGLTSLTVGRVRLAAALIAAGAAAVSMAKPYIFFPLVLAVGVWLYVRDAARDGRRIRIRPLTFLVAAGIALAGVVVLSWAFPMYSVDTLGETVAMRQYYGRSAGGGSFIEVGNEEERSLLGQLSFAPLALISVLFRPFFFEVENAALFINAVETLGLTVLFVRAMWRGPRALWNRTIHSPMLAFSLVFVLLMAVGVGLATTNLGTLSRYRIPLMPFFAILLLLSQGEPRRRARRAPGRPAPPARRRTP